MSQYAVYHMEKGNVSSGGIGNHIDRKKGAEHTFQHADKSKMHLNQNFELNKYCSMPLNKAIDERIKEGYKGSKAIRKDAVKYTTHILTGSHEKMKEIEKNPEKLRDWVIENKKFLEREFGKENIVRFTIHRDEKTPHLHAVTVNLTSDGRLSAKEIIGNKKDMQNRQDRYAQAMQSFGLERGLKNTGIKHENAQEYYKRINHSLKVEKIKDFSVDKNIMGIKWATFGVDKDKTIENLQNAVKSQITALKSKDFELEKIKSEKEQINSKKDYSLKEVESLKSKVNHLNEKYENVLVNDYVRNELIKDKLNEFIERSELNIKYASNPIDDLYIANESLKKVPLKISTINELENLINKHQGAEKWKEVFVDQINQKNAEIRYNQVSNFVNAYENKFQNSRNFITNDDWDSMVERGVDKFEIEESKIKELGKEKALSQHVDKYMGEDYFKKNLDEKANQRNKEIEEEQKRQQQRGRGRSW